MAVFLHPLLAMREADRAGDVVVDRVIDLFAELGIELRGIALVLDDVPGGRIVRHIAGRMPGRARGKLIAVDQQAIGPAELRQVIEHAGADGPAADDHYAGMIGHIASLSSSRQRRALLLTPTLTLPRFGGGDALLPPPIRGRAGVGVCAFVTPAASPRGRGARAAWRGSGRRPRRRRGAGSVSP